MQPEFETPHIREIGNTRQKGLVRHEIRPAIAQPSEIGVPRGGRAHVPIRHATKTIVAHEFRADRENFAQGIVHDLGNRTAIEIQTLLRRELGERTDSLEDRSAGRALSLLLIEGPGEFLLQLTEHGKAPPGLRGRLQ